MMEETVADADSPCHYVESGAADVVEVPSSEPISPDAGGGARPHRTVGGFRPTGQGNSGRHGGYAEKSFPLAQAFPGAGRATRTGPDASPTIGTRLTKRVVTMTTRQQPTNATH